MRSSLALLLSLGLVGCTESDFAGGAKAASPKKTEGQDAKGGKDGEDAGGPHGDDGPDEAGEGGSDESEEALGKSVEDDPIAETNEVCAAAKPETPVDEAATFTFPNEDEMRAFLNGLGKYTHVNDQFFNAGGVQADQVSADAVCNIKGYKKAATFGTKHYHSCGDNFVYPWDAAVKNFKQVGACTNNSRLGTLTCQGKLKEICGKDPGWVFGRPPL